MAKKGTKKKAARKTVGRKAAKRKTARRTIARKTTAGQTQMKTVKFRCAGGTCKAEPPTPTHTGKEKNKVKLSAPESDVTIDFLDGSPFQEGSHFFISGGTSQVVTVKSGAPRSDPYPYKLKCENPGCGLLVSDPEMICP